MKRWLYAHRPVTGNPERLERRLRSDLPELLRNATDSPDEAPGADGSFRIRLETSTLGVPLAKTARVHTGVATTTPDGRLRVPLTWRAEPGGAAFPTFDGAVELEPLSSWNVQIALVGTYDVPFGPLGVAIDSSLLVGAAEATAQRLVDSLAAAIAREKPPEEAEVQRPSRHLRVADVMTRDPVVFPIDAPLRTAALVLFHHRISGAPVLDGDGGLVGVLSERDLLHKEAGSVKDRRGDARRRSRASTVGEACSRPALTTVPDVHLREAARVMLEHDVARLVVIDDSRVAGMVTRHDVLRALLRTEEDLQDAVDDLLERLDEPEVKAEVSWGEVELSGRVRLRSHISSVFEAVGEIDGIVGVTGEVGWVEDDLPFGVPLNPIT